jgi:hypothetical protein
MIRFFFVLHTLSLFCQLAQGDGEVSRGALQTVGARFEFFHAVVGADVDGGERRVNLRREAFGSRLRFLLGA